MSIELTNQYTKDCYSHYEDICDKHYIKKEDILRISIETGRDIESYWAYGTKQNNYVYINENGTTKKIQIDDKSFEKLKKMFEEE